MKSGRLKTEFKFHSFSEFIQIFFNAVMMMYKLKPMQKQHFKCIKYQTKGRIKPSVKRKVYLANLNT